LIETGDACADDDRVELGAGARSCLVPDRWHRIHAVLLRLIGTPEVARSDAASSSPKRLGNPLCEKRPLQACVAPAVIILEGVEADRWRILVGSDAGG
jgi:hypothetical protein